LKRGEEELPILASDCERFIKWQLQQLDQVELALAVCHPGTVINDIVLERSARSLQALEDMTALNKTIEGLKTLYPSSASFDSLKSNLSVN
jgi:hypothetical protein